MKFFSTVKIIIYACIPAKDIYILCNVCVDNTAAEVEKCGVKPIISPVSGKERTLGWACHKARIFDSHTHVCFFDADTVIHGQYFHVVRERLMQDPSIDIVAGRPKSQRHNWLTAHRAVQYWSFHRLHKAAQSRINAILVVPGCAGTYSIRALDAIVWSGDTRIGDMDATIQAVNQGMRIVYERKAIVHTQDPASLRDYTNQLYWRWNRGLWMNMRKHGVLWRGPFSMMHWSCRFTFLDQFLPILYLLFLYYGDRTYSLGSLLIWVAVVTGQAIWCAAEEKRPDILLYLPVFPLMRVYDLLLFQLSSWNIFVKKEKNEVWTSPSRYDVEKIA
jgi:cellulose synthase/poly-beta-1,6-N-acetylglucosamine synthase-like glycosyltransferase